MPSFDFITEGEFRESLESDFGEMRKCIESSSWKSAQVIAGSIIEALLIDYLVSVPNPARTSAKSPLAMDLSDAIAICRAEKVLTDRTADLCSVVRSYRNLIHPGRLVRLNEPAPSRDSATIALSLVEIITDEVATTRRKTVGLTAEQLLSKIERDADVLSFFKHLVLEASEPQRQRLLLQLIPAAHAKRDLEDEFDWHVAQRLQSAYQVTLSTVSDDIKAKAAAEFVRLLREEDGASVARYAAAFFRGANIKFVPSSQRPLVLGYLLNRLETEPSEATLNIVENMEEFLDASDASKWLDPLVRIAVNSSNPDLRSKAGYMITWSEFTSSPEFVKAVLDRLAAWKRTYVKSGAEKKVKAVDELIDSFSPPGGG